MLIVLVITCPSPCLSATGSSRLPDDGFGLPTAVAGDGLSQGRGRSLRGLANEGLACGLL